MTIGKLGAFELEKDNWEAYVDRLEQYFVANQVKAEIQVATLITVIGSEAYELMVNLCTPDKPASKTYANLVTLMKNHLNPKPSQLAERFKFRQRIQKQEENVAMYVAELKKLSKHCGFQNLAENLRDQFVCGLINDDMRQKLFTEDDKISFDKAFTIAMSMEAAETNAALVEGCTRGRSSGDSVPSVDTAVHFMGRNKKVKGVNESGITRAARNSPNGGGGPSGTSGASSGKYRANSTRTNTTNQNHKCNVCGGAHEEHTCKFKMYVCRVCNQEGHLKKMCPKLRGNTSLNNIHEQENMGINNQDSDSDEAKDTHNHGIFKNTGWTRKSMKKTKDSFSINKEIVKLRHDFNNINLRNRVTLKGLEPLKLKSNIFNDKSLIDECLNTNYEAEENIFLHEFSEDLTELEIRNDNEFKVNPKIKPLKHIKTYRETQYYRRPKHANGGLLDLNKDINENNEDIFKVEITNKSLSPQNFKETKHVEQSTKHVIKRNVSPNYLHEPVSDLQSLLIMMTISSKTNEDEEIDDEVENNNVETPKSERNYSNIDSKFDSTNSITCEGIDNILSITPIRVQIDDKKTYLMRKFVNKWKSYVNNRKKYVSEQRQTTLNHFFDKIAKKKMDMNQSMEPDNKAKLLVRDYNTYQHRYKIQKHIIALQKAKLEEQNRLIEELKYNKIVEASRQSVDAMREEVRKTYYEIDRHLKPKIKCLTNELHIPEIDDQSLVLQCLKVPQFLQRMEKRAREREEKHALIRERRRQMEEERIRVKQQAELAKAEMDKEEKIKRMLELRQKRRKEKIENIRKKQWASRLRALIVMADLHYEKTLKAKYGIRPLRILIEIKRDNVEKAKAHYIFQLKNNTFLHWMWHTEDMWIERNFKAENFWRKKLLKKALEAFKRNHHGLVLKKQVADDYYDLYITQMAFRMLCEGINVIKKENEIKWQKAVLYHGSNLLFKTFTCWRTLPALNALKREQEARKARWRQKVLQVVPDYTPPED